MCGCYSRVTQRCASFALLCGSCTAFRLLCGLACMHANDLVTVPRLRTAEEAEVRCLRACIFTFPCICVVPFRHFWVAMNLAYGKGGGAALLGGRARPRRESRERVIGGITVSMELGQSGGGGRSALRPGGDSRACGVDRPPALFSYAEENPRPYEPAPSRPQEPAYSSSTGDGTGSGGPDRKLNSGRIL
jgi:hypothetical protein